MTTQKQTAAEIVERLRAFRPYCLNDEWFTPPLCLDAADTIEKLYEALETILRAEAPKDENWVGLLNRIQQIAENALGDYRAAHTPSGDSHQ
jgi:hypothetical protein